MQLVLALEVRCLHFGVRIPGLHGVDALGDAREMRPIGDGQRGAQLSLLHRREFVRLVLLRLGGSRLRRTSSACLTYQIRRCRYRLLLLLVLLLQFHG